ncbi:MAG: recombinase family protein [Porcipelethomonas sp.]
MIFISTQILHKVRACKDYAAVKDYNVIDVYADEALSGKGSKTSSRAQYQKMLRDCHKETFETIHTTVSPKMINEKQKCFFESLS